MTADPRDVVDVLFDDDHTPPAAPSRPAAEPTRIRGVSADDWALGIERKLDAIALAQHEALEESAHSLRVLAGEIRDGFARIGEVLKTQEQQGREIRDLRSDVNGHARQLAEHRADIEKLKKAAKERLKGKR